MHSHGRARGGARRASVSAFAPVDVDGDALGSELVPQHHAGSPHRASPLRRPGGSSKRARARAAAAAAATIPRKPVRPDDSGSVGAVASASPESSRHGGYHSPVKPRQPSRGDDRHDSQAADTGSSDSRATPRRPHPLGDIDMMQHAAQRGGAGFHVNKGGGTSTHGTGKASYVSVDAKGVSQLRVEHEASPAMQRRITVGIVCAVMCCFALVVVGAGAGVGGYMWWLKSQEDPDAATALAELRVERNVTVKSLSEESIHTLGGLVVGSRIAVKGQAQVRFMCCRQTPKAADSHSHNPPGIRKPACPWQ